MLYPQKIKSIKRRAYIGKVYNLAVENDETYIAEGIVVHNCRSTLIPILKDEIEQGQIYGATEDQNKEFFDENGKFIESSKELDGYKMQPGGFWVKK
jgi:hypothetical protein